MDLKDSIYQIVSRWERSKGNLATEEATKNALIMPMLMALGYDIFNPDEVLPEMTCDIGTKKGEKIDYAIMGDGVPRILIECKQWEQNLNLHDNQLLRYFNVSNAKFGILTNGLEYRIYTDLTKPNVMDEVPFLSFDIRNIKEQHIEELKKFHKSYFNIENILTSANELKYMSQLKDICKAEFSNPSSELVKYFAKKIYDGLYTQKIAEQMQSLVKNALQTYINEHISNKVNAILNNVEEPHTENERGNESGNESKNTIVTTEDELQAFNIIKAILRKDVDLSRIAMRDAATYCAILFDNNNRKPIVRLYFNNPNNLRISFVMDNGIEEKIAISTLDSIYDYDEKLREAIKRYIG